MNTTYRIKRMTVVALLSALGFVLMLLDFPVPLVPAFIQFDFSDIPAMIAAYILGPIAGVTVCFLKNVIHLLVTSTGGIGEIANFLLGVCLVLPAGLIYRRGHNFRSALIGCAVGCFSMALLGGVVLNGLIVYPLYDKLIVPMDAILKMYQAILPSADTLWKALAIFNAPFTFVKGIAATLVTLLCYRRLEPLFRKDNK